jgi:hypothetical protein
MNKVKLRPTILFRSIHIFALCGLIVVDIECAAIHF